MRRLPQDDAPCGAVGSRCAICFLCFASSLHWAAASSGDLRSASSELLAADVVRYQTVGHHATVAAAAAAAVPKAALAEDSPSQRLSTAQSALVRRESSRRAAVQQQQQHLGAEVAAAQGRSGSQMQALLQLVGVGAANVTANASAKAASNDTANASAAANTTANARASANRMNQTSSAEPSAVVCISGLFRGLKQNLTQNIRTQLLDALQEPVDVVIAGPPYPNMSAERTKAGVEQLRPVAIRVHEEPRVEELWSLAYEKMPSEAFSVLETWGDSGGSTAFGPSFGNGFGIYQWYWRSQCLEMIEEREKTRGKPYDRVVVTRYDYKWLAPHPPLRLLDKGMLWVPDGVSETGINDHHAVVPRGLADVWMGVYRLLLSGEISNLLKTPKVEISWRNPEVILLALAERHNISYRMFAPSAAVVGCPGNGDFHCVFARCREKGLEDYRSCDEAKAALHTANRFFNDSNGTYTKQLVEHIW
eukprot:TRINITY_DN47283_c0_g1_i1.p1 TRINITY_DN47283_c0_g1~~TRINITY_DN47283_c0_g1_i1.p1  ORF type:complete len:519 (-),score=107.63 TRINITY_DN47283_c0_g1_i1:50-1483(-)